jgi:tetratricopeptide (TPR) repeat protein
MPESTCLHIQDRESGPIRVVDLPWISVRIGRAAYCEIRLTEAELAEEACRLYRRGRSWHLVPVKSKGLVCLGGRPVDAACELPFDVPFRVGDHCLTLRRDRAAEPDWDLYAEPMPAEGNPPAFDPDYPQPCAEPATRPDLLGAPRSSARAAARDAPRGDGPANGFDRGSGHRKAVNVKDRWETRWRAVGAELKSRQERARTRCEPPTTPFQSGLDPVPLKEARLPHAQPGARRSVEPPAWPTPATTGAAQVEPTSTVSEVEPTTAHPPSQDLLSDRIAQDNWLDPLRTLLEHTGPVSCQTEPASAPPAETVAVAVAREESIRTASLLSTQPIAVAGAGPLGGDAPMIAPARAPAISSLGESQHDHDPEAGEFQPRYAGSPRPTASAVAPSDAELEAPVPEADLTEEQPLDDPIALDSRPRQRATIRRPPRAETTREASAEPQDSRELWPNIADLPEAHPTAKRADLPSAKHILATHRSMARPQPANPQARRQQKHAGPTLACEPSHWTLPAWLAGLPAAFFIAAGLAGCVMSWWWALDSYSASVMTAHLMTNDRLAQRAPLPDSIAPPRGSWTLSTAQHLAHWAIFLSQNDTGSEPSAGEVESLLGRAVQAAPLNPTARLALAELDQAASGRAVSVRALGLSRDAVSLSWCAQVLLAAGNKDDARKLYARALRVAAHTESARIVVPRFSDDPGVPRYLLPGEERVRDILNQLVSSKQWTFREWSAALPDSPAVSLAAARLLREQGHREAEALLERVVDEQQPQGAAGWPGAIVLAARAEAFALKSRWREAEAEYRLAIDLIDDETIKRSWWFNLADIALRLDEEGLRQTALRAALAVANSDDIARRVGEIQRATNARQRSRSRGAKAN